MLVFFRMQIPERSAAYLKEKSQNENVEHLTAEQLADVLRLFCMDSDQDEDLDYRLQRTMCGHSWTTVGLTLSPPAVKTQ
jgi:hypothetical protein